MVLGFDPYIGKIIWRRKWQPMLVFLPGESRGQRSLAGYSPWGCKESERTETAEHAQNYLLGPALCFCTCAFRLLVELGVSWVWELPLSGTNPNLISLILLKLCPEPQPQTWLLAQFSGCSTELGVHLLSEERGHLNTFLSMWGFDDQPREGEEERIGLLISKWQQVQTSVWGLRPGTVTVSTLSQ